MIYGVTSKVVRRTLPLLAISSRLTSSGEGEIGVSSLSHSPETRAGVLLAHTFTSDLDCTRTGLRQGRCGELAAAKPVSSFVRPVALTFQVWRKSAPRASDFAVVPRTQERLWTCCCKTEFECVQPCPWDDEGAAGALAAPVGVRALLCGDLPLLERVPAGEA